MTLVGPSAGAAVTCAEAYFVSVADVVPTSRGGGGEEAAATIILHDTAQRLRYVLFLLPPLLCLLPPSCARATSSLAALPQMLVQAERTRAHACSSCGLIPLHGASERWWSRQCAEGACALGDWEVREMAVKLGLDVGGVQMIVQWERGIPSPHPCLTYPPKSYGPFPTDAYQAQYIQEPPRDFQPQAPQVQQQTPSPSRKSMFHFISPFDALDAWTLLAMDPKRTLMENLMDQLTRCQGPPPQRQLDSDSPEPGTPLSEPIHFHEGAGRPQVAGP
ncbi:hypothetical protein DFH11DRAFT_1726298 [Phellopilus nigrolimitatus]|nr:hypothetical protein DFH11DRAFT_1726298 [Phellopilus nigrolimitatus]